MRLLLFFVLVHITLLVSGYTLVRKSKLLAGKPALELCVGYAASLVLFGGVATLGYVLKLPFLLLQVVLIGAMLGSLFFFVKDKLWRQLTAFRFPLACLVVMSLFTCCFISLSLTGARPFIPDPEPLPNRNYTVFDVKVLNVAQTNANDNSVPYRQAQFMVNRSDPAKDSFIEEWGVTFFQRTPLMGAVTAGYFTLLGERPPIGYIWSADAPDPQQTYQQFQIIAAMLNALLVLPAFFLLAKLFNRRTAQVALLFIVPSQYFLFSSFFSWPKSLVAFFVLLSWLLILENRLRYVLLAGVAAGLAYLTHDLAVLYLAATVLLLIYYRRFAHIAYFLAVNVLCALPWVITSAIIYKKPSTFIYYPLSIHNIPQLDQRQEIIHEFFHTSPLRLLAIRLESLFYLMSPYQAIYSEGGQAVGRRIWALGLFSVPGALGLGMFWAALGGVFKKIRDLPFWILVLVPIIMSVVVIGWPKGLGALHFAQASIVLLIGLGAWFLLRLKRKFWLALAFLANTVQLVFFAVYSYNFQWRTWFTSFQDIVLLLCLVAIVGLCAVGLDYIVTGGLRVAKTPTKAKAKVRHG